MIVNNRFSSIQEETPSPANPAEESLQAAREQVSETFAAAEALYDQIISYLVSYSFQIVGAILVLAAGVWLSGRLHRFVLKFCEKRKVDSTLSKFVAGMLKGISLLFVAIIVLNQLNITISPFIAALGAGAFGLTLALQGPVSNYGAGLTLILTRPFKVGDTLSVVERSGIVQEIKLAFTLLKTEDDELISIPNRKIVGEVYENTFQVKLINGIVGIAYSQDPETTIAILKKALESSEWVEKSPPPQVGIQGFNQSSIDIGYRCWVPTQRYHQHHYETNLKVFQTLRENAISIPFPQREVRILNGSENKEPDNPA